MPPAGELASAVAVLATGRRRCEARGRSDRKHGHDMQGFGTQLDSRISLTTTAGVLSSTAVFIIASDPCVGKWSPELDRGRSLPCASVLPPRPLRRCGNNESSQAVPDDLPCLTTFSSPWRDHPNEAGRRPPVSSDGDGLSLILYSIDVE